MKKIVALLAGGLLAMSAAQAAVVTVTSSNAHPAAPSGWMDNLSLQQFNSALGTLTSVVFNYGGTITSIFKVESLEAAPATITVKTDGNLVFGLPISFGLQLSTLIFSNSASQQVKAFDGTIDFTGGSGFGPTTVTATNNSGISTFTSGLSTFVGLDTYAVTVNSNASTGVTGAGNIITQINTNAAADIKVSYTYTEAPTQVPEPGSLALIGLALAGLGVMRRKSSKA